METLVLTEFKGLNTKSPIEELGSNPMESPNLINVIMEEGTIFSRAGQSTRYNFNAPTDKVSSLYFGKLGNTDVNIAQVGTTIKKQGGGGNLNFKWWNENWGYCRKIVIVNTTQKDYTNLLLDLRLQGGFDYTNFQANGGDIRFIPYNGSEPDVANYPNGLDYEIKVWAKGVSQTTLSADITATAETIPVVSTTSYPTQGLIIVENEKIWYNSKNATNFLQCMRGYEGTSAVAHILGKTVNLEGQIYVQIPFIKAGSTIDVYMYNGNAGATAVSQSLGIIRNFDAQGELQDFVMINAPSPDNGNTQLSISDGQLKFSKSQNGYIGYAQYNKSLQNASAVYEVELVTYGAGNYGDKGIELTKAGDSYYTGVYLRYSWDGYYARYDIFFGESGTNFKTWSSVGSYSTIGFKLIIDSSTKKATAEIWVSNVLKYIYTASYSGERYIFNFGSVFGHNYQTGLCISAYIMKIYNRLPSAVTWSLGAEIPKPTGPDDVNWTQLYPDALNIYPVSEKPYQILSFLKNYIFITEDKEVLMWDGTTTKKVGGGKKAKFGLVHKNRLWLFNFPGVSQPTMVQYSNINQIELLTHWQTNGVDNKEFINADDGFEILGVGLMSDSIAIHKGNGIWLWYGDIPNHAIKKLNIDVGCIAWRTVAEWENGQFFMSTKGVHFLRGSVAETPIIFTVDNIQSDNLAEKIMPTFKNINPRAIQNSIGIMWNSRYFLAIPSYSSDVNDMILVLDYKRGWWSVWKLPTDAITGLPLYAITSMFVYTKTNELYIGTTIGQILLQGNRKFYNDVLEDNIGGQAISISNIYETGDMDLGSPNVRKRLRFIEPVYSGNMTLGIMVDKANEQNWNLTDITKTGLVKGKIGVLKIGRFFRLKFSNIEKQLHSVTLHYDYMRN